MDLAKDQNEVAIKSLPSVLGSGPILIDAIVKAGVFDALHSKDLGFTLASYFIQKLLGILNRRITYRNIREIVNHRKTPQVEGVSLCSERNIVDKQLSVLESHVPILSS
jgi:hypothetical protein